MTLNWGSDTWGSGVWGSHDNYVPILQENWPYRPGYPDKGDALYDILQAIHTDIGRLDLVSDVLKQQRFIDEATGEELERLAREVGVIRQSGEGDDRLRLRVRIRKAGSRSRGTAPDFAQVLEFIFGDDVSNISLDSSVSEPVVEVQLPQILVDDIPLTNAELEDQLETTLPASDAVTIVTDDTFIFGASGGQGLGNGNLS